MGCSGWRSAVVRWALLLGLTSTVTAPAAEGDTYTVQPGDTLGRISALLVGDALRYRELFEINRDLLGSPDAVEVGMVLRVPVRWSQGPASPGARPPVVAPPTEDEARALQGQAVIATAKPPSADPMEWLVFFPSLAELDQDFDRLMLRVAYAGDVEWGQARAAELRADELLRLEQQVLAAEVAFQGAQARHDLCEEGARRARALLASLELSDDDRYEQAQRYLSELADALRAEQAMVAEKLDPYETDEMIEWFEEVVRLIREEEAFEEASVIHDKYADAIGQILVRQRDVELQPWELQVLGGHWVKVKLEALISTQSSEGFKEYARLKARQEEALYTVTQLASCKRELTDAQAFLDEQRRKRVSLQATLRGAADGALKTDALRIAQRYSGVLREVQLVDAYINNRLWTDIWWKAGVALRLAGEQDLGRQRLVQAASVAEEQRLPASNVPPSIEGWLRDAENEVLRREMGGMRLSVPVGARATVDGLDVVTDFGMADLELPEGIHRLVIWWDGEAPVTRLVGVAAGEVAAVTWSARSKLDGDAQAVIGEEPVMPVLPKEQGPKRWHVGVAAGAAWRFGMPMVGADLHVRYLPRNVGFSFGAGLMGSFEPLWVRVDEQFSAITRVRGSVVAGGDAGPVRIVGGVGVWGEPYLGLGPEVHLDLSGEVAPNVRLGVDLRGAWDAMPHMDGVKRPMLQGGIIVWL